MSQMCIELENQFALSNMYSLTFGNRKITNFPSFTLEIQCNKRPLIEENTKKESFEGSLVLAVAIDLFTMYTYIRIVSSYLLFCNSIFFPSWLVFRCLIDAQMYNSTSLFTLGLMPHDGRWR